MALITRHTATNWQQPPRPFSASAVPLIPMPIAYILLFVRYTYVNL